MTPHNSLVDEVMDRIQLAGAATAKRMFGGVGIFHNGLMFALIAGNELYLKADKHSVQFFIDHDLPAFSYSKANGKVFRLSYYLAPESFFEDDEETLHWTQLAIDAAVRAPAKQQKTPKN